VGDDGGAQRRQPGARRGYIDNGLTTSYAMLVTMDEVIGMVGRFMGGITVDQETLAQDVIDRVGPGGQFVSDDHTLAHFRENWVPGLLEPRQLHQVGCGRPADIGRPGGSPRARAAGQAPAGAAGRECRRTSGGDRRPRRGTGRQVRMPERHTIAPTRSLICYCSRSSPAFAAG